MPTVQVDIEQINIDSVLRSSTVKAANNALMSIVNNRMDPEQTARFIGNFDPDVIANILCALETADAIAVLSQLFAAHNYGLLKKVLAKISKESAEKDLIDKIKSYLSGPELIDEAVKKIEAVDLDDKENSKRSGLARAQDENTEKQLAGSKLL